MFRLFAPPRLRRAWFRRAAGFVWFAFLTLIVPAATAATPGAGPSHRGAPARSTADFQAVVCAAPGDQVTPRLVPDGVGGVIVVWVDGRGADPDLYAQHLLGSFDPDPTWPPGGVVVCAAAGAQTNPYLVPDGAGGAIVVWEDERSGAPDVYAQHLLASGAADPAWPADGIALGTDPADERYPSLDGDGAGGAFVAWQRGGDGSALGEVRVQHVLAAGTPDPAWPPEGVLLSAASFPHLVADGAGGAIVVCSSVAPDAARRVLAGGVEDPAWRPMDVDGAWYIDLFAAATDGAGGAYVLCSGFGVVHATASGAPAPLVSFGHWFRSVDPGEPVVAADGAGGAVAAFSVPPPDSPGGMDQQGIYAKLVRPTGEILAWMLPREGSPPARDHTTEPCVAPDGAGGMLVAWTDDRPGARPDIFLQHVLATGGADPTCAARGRMVSSWMPGPARDPQMVSDGAGGAFIVWQGGGSGAWNIYAARISGDAPTSVLASLVATEATAERVRLEWLCTGGAGPATIERRTASTDWRRIATAFADGGGRVVHEDRDVVPGARHGYRLVLSTEGRDTPAGETWVTVPARLALGLHGPHPNPVEGDLAIAFVLPDDRPARIEVVDASGRRVLDEPLGSRGPGEHVARFPATRSLQAGLHFVRLRHGERTLTRRFVFLR
jgi:hypothetical protein